MTDSSKYIPCRISLCEPEVETKIEDIPDNSNKFVVELGTTNPNILLTEGQTINVDQVIGYMNNIPVKSIINGTITEVTDRYFIGTYGGADSVISELGINEISEDSIREAFTNKESDFDKINELLKESSQVNNFIKDYILRFRFADIANNFINYSDVGVSESYNTTSNICEKYNKSADEIINEYNKEIQSTCDADNIKTFCENSNLMGLKKNIYETKQKYFDKIIWQYNHIESFGHNSGRLSDMMLYDEYLNYITSDDFVYDDTNPYVVDLLYHITTFLQIRSRLELNKTNIAELIIKFNTLCNNNIKKYWDDKLYDYYGRIKQIFMYDFYEDNENDLIEAHIHDKKRVTLYSKVLKYLETLCNYVPPVSIEEKYKDMDTNSIINNSQIEDTESEKEMKQLHSNLKKIAIMFVQLRKIESDVDPKYFEQFASADDYNDLFTLKEQIGDQNLKEFTLRYNNLYGTSGENFLVIQAQYEMLEKKCLDSFKKMTQRESKILRDLSDKAIQFYYEKDSMINSGEIFDQFQQADWGGRTTVFKDKEPYDFYYIKEPTSTKDKMNSPIMNGEQPKEILDENSTKSAYGVSDYEYWVKYCGIATIVNCMMPGFWPTGLVVAGSPIPMPIIFIPFCVVSGRVTVVIGLGICGICPLPMILFTNLANFPGSLIPPLNIYVDLLKHMASMIPSMTLKPIKEAIKGLIKAQDEKIVAMKKERKKINEKIAKLVVSVQTDKETLRNLKKKRKENHTTNTTKKQSSE